MIIAWGLFLLSIWGILGTLLMVKDGNSFGKLSGETVFVFWFIIILCSAQYIWG